MNHCSVAYTLYEIDYRVRRYAEALVARGNRVDVLSLNIDKKNQCEKLNGVNISHVHTRKFEEKGRLSYLINILKFFLKGSFVLLYNYLKYRYKIIHIHNIPDFLVFMAFIPKLLGAKVILDIHDILPELYSQKFNKGLDTFLGKSLLLVERISIRYADHVIVANDLWREKIIRRDNVSPEKCTTMLNYPNLELFNTATNAQKNEKFTLIYPGHLSYHHGIDIAIKALHIVKQEVPSVVLEIYAASWISEYRNYLLELIEDLNLKENVKFHEPVGIEKLAKIYKGVNIGVVPKRGGLFASEAFSTKMFDYMAAGIPIVASETKVDEYYFDDSMIMFFEPENHSDMARCIIELYKNPVKGESLVKNARRFVVENNWEDKKGIYLDLVDSLVDQKDKGQRSKEKAGNF